MRSILVLALLLACGPTFAANCYITEYEEMPQDSNGNILPIPGSRHNDLSVVSHTSPTSSAAFSSWARFAYVICDAKSFFAYGGNPTASNTGTTSYLVADQGRYFGIQPTWKFSFCDSDCS